jgi:hypothetical protein
VNDGLMTDPQRGFVRSLYSQVNELLPLADIALQQTILSTLTPVAPHIAGALSDAPVEYQHASPTIDSLKAVLTLLGPVKAAVQEAKAKAEAAQYPYLQGAERVITNKFAKKCVVCASIVGAGEGLAAKMPYGWATYCKECASVDPAQMAAERAAAAEKLRAEQDAVRVLQAQLRDQTMELHDRIVETTGSTTKDKAIRIVLPGKVVDVDNSEAAYQVSIDIDTQKGVQRHTGGPGYLQVFPVGLERAIEIVTMLNDMSDVELAQVQAAYGMHFHECGRCGAPLSDDTSKARGLGPDCYSKVGW